MVKVSFLIQRILADTEFDCGKVDGLWGENTRKGIALFQEQVMKQKVHGKARGIPGPNTVRAIVECTSTLEEQEKTLSEEDSPPEDEVSEDDFVWEKNEEESVDDFRGPVREKRIVEGKFLKRGVLNEPYFDIKLEAVARALNVNKDDLITIFQIETAGTFDSSSKNPGSTASGLIGFMGSTAKRLGTTTEKIREMTGTQQLDLVQEYLHEHLQDRRETGLGDLYLAVAAPRGLGKDDNFTLYKEGTKEWRKNAEWRMGRKKGDITVGDIKRYALQKSAQYAVQKSPDAIT